MSLTAARTGPGGAPAALAAGAASPARRDATTRVLTGAGLAAALLLVTFWWAQDGGVRDLAGWASGLTSLGRITGLVASVLLLAQVLLMARLPWLERAYGQDRLARLHRVVGFTSFDLVVAHLVAITWGYALGSLVAVPTTFWQLVADYPGMLLAAAGTVALVMVVVTSVRAARRSLRYESWHLLHLYAYLGVGLALPHQLWTGQQFTSSPARTVFWWGAWAAAAVAVLVWRVALPLGLNLRHRLEVTSVVPEAPGVVSVYLTGRHLHRLPVRAGQFLSWRFLHGPGWTRANPYSLSAAPDGRTLRITVQEVGDGSAVASRLRPGTRALVEGPYGRLTDRPRTRPRVALIGAGAGMAPIRSLAEGLAYAPGDAVLVQRSSDHALYAGELASLATDRGLAVVDLPGRRRSPDSWLPVGVPPTVDDATALLHLVPDVADRDVYVCGPEAWTEHVVRALVAAGLPAEQLHLETFRW
jgi:predicted ferric reductase